MVEEGECKGACGVGAKEEEEWECERGHGQHDSVKSKRASNYIQACESRPPRGCCIIIYFS